MDKRKTGKNRVNFGLKKDALHLKFKNEKEWLNVKVKKET